MASMDREVDHAAKLFGGSVKYVDAFRLLMRKYRALVSGSTVLRLFVEDQAVRSGRQAETWVPSDLDVYVKRLSLGPLGLLEWHVHFTNVEGMDFDLQGEREREYPHGEVGIFEPCLVFGIDGKCRSFRTLIGGINARYS
jgi:hypothetical protein